MFTHLRFFAGISLVVLIAAAVAITFYFNSSKQLDLMDMNRQQQESTLTSYVSAVWERYAAEIIANPSSPYVPSFNAETRRFFERQHYIKITIFSPDVQRLYYGSSTNYITTDGTTQITLFDLEKVATGKAVSRIITKAYLSGPESSPEKRTLVQSIIPITRPGKTSPDALAEIYVDIGNKDSMFGQELKLFVGSILGISVLMIAVSLITARRAESVITKQHEVNLELVATAAQAEAQSQEKSQFLASVSHELRTPLNAIIGFSEIIRNEAKEKLDKVYQDYVDDINASGKHLLSLINDILDYSKAEAGKLQMEWAETDATKIIRNSLRMVLPRAETAQVTLIEDIPAHHLVIVTDAKKLKQVLLNLLSNAVKFTPAGGEVRCHAWNDVVTGNLVLEVRDTGIGIAPKDISRVMTPFGQVDSALSRKYEGTGLGLPLSKKFVESMGGVFSIESQLKVGTTVTISIPKAPVGWGTTITDDPLAHESNHVASHT